MPVVFVIPIRSFHLGKSRLAGALDQIDRKRLARHLANHVVTTLRSSDVETAVVTADEEVASWVSGVGVEVVRDPGRGLDRAASVGANWAIDRKQPWVIIHGDLPRLTVRDVTSVRDGLVRSGAVIAPSADGGTSAIGAHTPIEFSYGPASFHRHLTRLGQPELVVRTGLLFDIDDSHDLRQAGLESVAMSDRSRS